MSYTAPTSAFAPFLGATAYFAPEGETIESTTVAEDAKPPGDDFTDWEVLGCIEDGNINRNYTDGEVRDCFNATSGIYEKKPTKGQLCELSYDLTIQTLTEFLLQVAHNVATIDADGAGVPNSQLQGIYRGWVKVQSQNGTEVLTVLEGWVELTMPNAQRIAGNQSATVQVNLRVIDVTDNAIQFGTDTV